MNWQTSLAPLAAAFAPRESPVCKSQGSPNTANAPIPSTPIPLLPLALASHSSLPSPTPPSLLCSCPDYPARVHDVSTFLPSSEASPKLKNTLKGLGAFHAWPSGSPGVTLCRYWCCWPRAPSGGVPECAAHRGSPDTHVKPHYWADVHCAPRQRTPQGLFPNQWSSVFRTTSAACSVKGNFPFIYQVQCRGSSLMMLLTSQGFRRVICWPPKELLGRRGQGVGEHRFTAPLVVLMTFSNLDRHWGGTSCSACSECHLHPAWHPMLLFR